MHRAYHLSQFPVPSCQLPHIKPLAFASELAHSPPKASPIHSSSSTLVSSHNNITRGAFLYLILPYSSHFASTSYFLSPSRRCHGRSVSFRSRVPLPAPGFAFAGGHRSRRFATIFGLQQPFSQNTRRFHSHLSMAPAAASSDSIKPRDVCIVGVARTPMGGFLGTLSSLSATKLGSIAIEAALKRANVDPSLVEEVIFGNVLSANLGQAPARQAALGAGIPNSVICTTVNKVCASGMKATMLAAQSIQLGTNDIVVAGGMESMSNVPKYLAEARKGSRLGHDSLVDGMLKDGLWDVYKDVGMGVCAELCADNHGLTRDDQDNFAIQSFERGIAAQESGAFSWEIVPVEVSGGRGRPSTVVDKDEGLGKFDAAKLRKLRPSFKESGGSVTAGNASSISDGAAALVLVSGEKALKLGLQVIAKITGYADAAQEPELFTTAPSLAIPKAISKAGLEASQIDFYEINEAFAVVALANQKLLGLNSEKVNVHGGAVALGHPLGCSGARILVTLLGVLKQKNGKYGVGGICNGGGGASALVLELL